MPQKAAVWWRVSVYHSSTYQNDPQRINRVTNLSVGWMVNGESCHIPSGIQGTQTKEGTYYLCNQLPD
jgi:hypothetical protein